MFSPAPVWGIFEGVRAAPEGEFTVTPDSSANLASRLAEAAPAVPRTTWAGYTARYGAANAARLAAQPAYLTLLNQVYAAHRAGQGIHALVDLLAAHIPRAGSRRRAIMDWHEALTGELRVVDLALGRRLTIPPRWASGLRGALEVGEGGGRPGSQFQNWSTWSVRALLLVETGDSQDYPRQGGGWGNRHGFHPSFITGGGDNQINHFALALRLYAVYRLPCAALVGPIPPQDPAHTADGRLTTAACWFVRGHRGRAGIIPPGDAAALKAVLRDGLEPYA